jgi:hypothetical protein
VEAWAGYSPLNRKIMEASVHSGFHEIKSSSTVFEQSTTVNKGDSIILHPDGCRRDWSPILDTAEPLCK